MAHPYLIDMHVHSDSSPDGADTPTSLCEKAIDRGLFALAITDHCEVNVFIKENYNRSVKQSFFEACKARAVFQDQIKTLIGIELGQATQDYHIADRIAQTPGLDFIIGSLHNTRGREDFAFIDYQQADVHVLLDEYYKELLELCCWGKFDVLGHLTYPLRYIEGQHGIRIDMERYSSQIDDIFKALISRGKGIEINTSTLRQELGRTMPETGYVKRYKALGGEILTVGSDAHCAEHVGANIEDAIAIAKAAGFDHIAYYEQRQPVFLPI